MLNHPTLSRYRWYLLVILSCAVGLYPSIYFILERRFGLLQTKSPELLSNIFWNMGFYTHIVLGGIALLIGWIQFSTKFRETHLNVHRAIGKGYVLCVVASALAGIGIGCFATGGGIAKAGFISLGLIWWYTTWKAYLLIRGKQVLEHQKMMIYSYAMTFAAVTLRIWLPILTLLFQDFIVAYQIVAWMCWVPNWIAAYFMTKQLPYSNQP